MESSWSDVNDEEDFQDLVEGIKNLDCTSQIIHYGLCGQQNAGLNSSL